MATYVNDLRLKEIATGDESGTWGVSTNTNLELIAEGFSYATVDPFDTDADKTETMADGATDPIRSLYVKVTSTATLTATRTLTLAPNTVSKVWIIENATTGGQSITISQGSGSTVTIPNGSVKMIYTDGAGATAAVTDAFANLKVTDPAQTNITSLGTLTSLTVSGDATFDTNTLYVDSTNNRVGVGTTSPSGALHVSVGQACELFLESRLENYASINFGDATDQDIGYIRYVNSDNSLRLATNTAEAMRINSSGNVGIGTTSPSQKLNVSTTSASQAILITTSSANSDSGIGFTNDARSWSLANRGGLSDSLVIRDVTGGADRVAIDTSGNVGIGTSSPVGVLTLQKDENASSTAGTGTTLTLNGNAGAGNPWEIYRDNGVSGDLIIAQDSSGTRSEKMRITSSAVGIGTSSPARAPLHLATSGTDYCQVHMTNGTSGSTSSDGLTLFTNGTDAGLIQRENSYLYFGTNDTERMRIDSSGRVLINNSGWEYGQLQVTADPAGTGSFSRGLAVGFQDNASEGDSTGLSFFMKVAISGVKWENARIAALTTGVTTSAYGQLAFYTMDATTLAERMRIDSSGNVGIGTSSPAYKLDLWDTGGGNIASFTNGVNADLRINCTSGVTLLTPSTGTLAFGTSSTERMRIDSSGNVGIGTSSPSEKLHVESRAKIGNITLAGNGSDSTLSAGNANFKISTLDFTGGATDLDFDVNIVVTGVGITNTFKVDSPTGDTYTNDGTVSSLSDERVKTDIQDLTDGLEIVKQLRPVTFKYNDDSTDDNGNSMLAAADDKIRYGFIAQEVEQIAPQYVEYSTRKINNVEVDDFRNLSTTRMLPMLFKAVQEQQVLIEQLQAEVALLKGE